MLGVDDPIWAKLQGGYRVEFDPRKAFQMLESGRPDEASAELWNGLHHQGDVGSASYASVPRLVKICNPTLLGDWNLYALIAIIEICRSDGRNPALPESWKADYEAALTEINKIAVDQIAITSDENFLASLFALVAACKKQFALARLALLTEQERNEMLDEVGWA